MAISASGCESTAVRGGVVGLVSTRDPCQAWGGSFKPVVVVERVCVNELAISVTRGAGKQTRGDRNSRGETKGISRDQKAESACMKWELVV